jgi:hypothetical protein
MRRISTARREGSSTREIKARRSVRLERLLFKANECCGVAGNAYAHLAEADSSRLLACGSLNPANGDYLSEFRMAGGVDTSYTKFKLSPQIDNNPYNKVVPPQICFM